MTQDSPTDDELVAQTLAGCREAFVQLYDRYARMVRAVVAGVSGDWPGAEDMVQESFMRAYRKLGSLHDPSRFGAWIVGIARQVGRERRRSMRRDRHEFGDTRPWQIASAADAETKADVRDEIEHVMRNVADLPERERLAIHMFFLEQHDARQGAELLGLSRNGFYGLLQRAISRLASQVHPCKSEQRAER
jgi:RNA polymerase sigma-70 factor (ECF subfamily)